VPVTHLVAGDPAGFAFKFQVLLSPRRVAKQTSSIVYYVPRADFALGRFWLASDTSEKQFCIHCGKEMRYSQESKMWVCDDCQVSRDGILEALPPNLASKLVSYYRALYIDGYGNAGISTAIVYLFTDGIRLQFDKKQINLSYDAIEVLTVTAEREITALRTFVLGAVLAAAFKKETKVLVIGFRDKFGLLQLPSFKMGKLGIEDCYNKILTRRTPNNH